MSSTASEVQDITKPVQTSKEKLKKAFGGSMIIDDDDEACASGIKEKPSVAPKKKKTAKA